MAVRMRNVDPIIDLKSIADLSVRDNFKILQDYFRTNNQLVGFKFVEYTFAQAQQNAKIAHTLGYTPKDILVLSTLGPGILTFNYNDFDANYLDVSSTGQASFRAFVGTYWDSQ
jgi:hypothetical protein